MPRHHITHACGHSQVHTLGGNSNSRASREAWLQKQHCKKCWQVKQPPRTPEIWLRPAGQNIEIIILWCFAHKDSLKNQGYAFDRFAVGKGSDDLYKMLLDGGNPGYHKLVPAEHEAAEIQWLKLQTWYNPTQVHHQGQIGRLIAAPIEGRRDLIEEPPDNG